MSVTETVAAASPAVSATEVSSQPSQSPSAVEDARRIYLGNLPRSVKPEDITAFLKGYTVENVSIPKSRFRHQRKIFAFVDLASATEAQKALGTLNENVLQDCKVSVKLANPFVPREKPEKKPKAESKETPKEASKKTSKKNKENGEPAVPATAPKEDKPAEVSKKSNAKSNRPRIKRERAPDNISPADSIFVSNVSNRTTKEDLAVFFKDLNPEWTHISFKRTNKDGRSFTQFFGFAKFKDTDTQQKAIAEFNGKKLGNRTIYVSAVTGNKKKNDESEASSKTGESKTVEATKETKEPKKKKEAKELKQPTDNKETKAVNDDKSASANEVKVAAQSAPSTTQP